MIYLGYGGILGSDGCIYGIPHNANGVLKIDPVTQEVSILAEGTLPDGQWKWHGGLASNDGTKIIGFPNNAGKFETNILNDILAFWCINEFSLHNLRLYFSH